MTKKPSKSRKDSKGKADKELKKWVKRPATERLHWRGVTARVRHTPDYLSKGWSHIEITVVSPKGAPLPITDTGYRSHFIDAEELRRSGGAVAYFLAWIERDAKSKAWAASEFKWRQGDLFAWDTERL